MFLKGNRIVAQSRYSLWCMPTVQSSAAVSFHQQWADPGTMSPVLSSFGTTKRCTSASGIIQFFLFLWTHSNCKINISACLKYRSIKGLLRQFDSSGKTPYSSLSNQILHPSLSTRAYKATIGRHSPISCSFATHSAIDATHTQ